MSERKLNGAQGSWALKILVSICLVSVLASPRAIAGVAGPNDSQMQTSENALNLIMKDQGDKGEDILLDAYKQGVASNSLNPEIPYFLAVYNLRHDNAKDALKYLIEAQKGYAKAGNQDIHNQMLLNKRLGECYYKLHDIKNALSAYNTARTQCKSIPNSALSEIEILEAIVACDIDLKQNDDAERNCLELVQITRDRLKDKHLYDTTNYCWALLELADFYKDTDQNDKLIPIRKQIHTLFTTLIRTRAEFQAMSKFSDYEALGKLLREQYIAELAPTTPAEKAWAANDFRMRTLPVVAWADLRERKPLAAIVCLHGLGLENRAFVASAAELNRRGYMVFSLDLRGFGSWNQTKGLETLDYSKTLSDIRNVVSVIKEDNPGLPVFLLGESMGGAVAIRAASELNDTLDGVISSVPSAERFKEKRMALNTALHFLADPNGAFNIGEKVADRATSNEKMKAVWEADPKAKLDMTPIELMKFDVFMRTTKGHAGQIDKVPVLVVQGLKDRLVKPQGTFELFDAVKTPDKTLLLIGTAEHLMFETANPSPLLMDSVDSWLKHHLTGPVAQNAAGQ